MSKDIAISFSHGLGDSVMFAHMIPLYTRRGYNVAVYCGDDLHKDSLFRAAGATILDAPREQHSWVFPPSGDPSFDDLSSRNKACWNISTAPMPCIGESKELAEEFFEVTIDMASQVSDEQDEYVRRMVEDLPRPLVLLHTTGNSLAKLKNVDELETANLYRGLIDRTDGTLLVLDWDQRAPRFHSHRMRHLGDDWRRLVVPELYSLIDKADLLIGVDSGPLHLTRCTNTKAIGWMTRHHPSWVQLPRQNTLHVCPFHFKDLNRLHRIWYNIVECRGETEQHWPEGDGLYPNGDAVAELANQLLQPPQYLPKEWHCRDVQLRHLLQWTRHPTVHATGFHDRHRTFHKVLEHLSAVQSPRVIETGCIRAKEDWGGAGYSTYWLGMALEAMGGHLDSVDCTEEHVAFARKWTAQFGDAVTVHQADSREWLQSYNGPLIDVFYADSADVGTPQYQEICLGEIQRAVKLLRRKGYILIDDMSYCQGEWDGKGSQAIPWLLAHGWDIIYGGHQVLLQRNAA